MPIQLFKIMIIEIMIMSYNNGLANKCIKYLNCFNKLQTLLI